MRFIKSRHTNVNPDGTFPNEGGAVETKGRVMTSYNGGCGLEHCNCSEGHWLNVVMPRTEDGLVEGITVYFDNKAEIEALKKALETI